MRRAVLLVALLGCSGVETPTTPCTVGYTICRGDPFLAFRCNDGRLARAVDWADLRPFNLSEVTAGGEACSS